MKILNKLSEILSIPPKKIVKVFTVIVVGFLILLVSGVICTGLWYFRGIDTVPIMAIICMLALFGILSILTKRLGAKIIHAILFVVFLLVLIDVGSEVFLEGHRSWLISEYKAWDNGARHNYKAGTDLEKKLVKDVRNKEVDQTKEGDKYLKNKDPKTALNVYGAILDSNENINFLIDSTQHVVKEKYNQKRKSIEKDQKDIKIEQTQSSKETLVGRIPNKTTAYFTADEPFSIILSVDKQANYIVQEMPAGNSSFYFDNGGYVRIQGGGRKDVKMTK